MTLEEIRSNINEIDTKIIDLLKERMDYAGEVARIKLQKGSRLIDEKREKEMVERLISIGKKKGISDGFLKKIFFEIIDESVRIQKNYTLGKHRD